MSSISETTLEITRLFDAPPARVFGAWLNREEWQAWIGPEGINCEVPLLEPRVGGRYRITMRLTDGRVIPVAGVFKTIEAPRTLAFTWGWEGDPSRESLITITLRAKGDKTEFTLRQEGLGSASTRDDHVKGWNGTLNKLVAHLATHMPVARMVVIYNTPRDPDAFDKHYFDVHVPLAKTLPGLRRYDVSQAAILAPAGDATPYLIATLHFDDLSAIKNAFASPEGQACAADRRLFAPDDADLEMYLFDTRQV